MCQLYKVIIIHIHFLRTWGFEKVSTQSLTPRTLSINSKVFSAAVYSVPSVACQNHGQHQTSVVSSFGSSVLYLCFQNVLETEIPREEIRSSFIFSQLFRQKVKEKGQEIRCCSAAVFHTVQTVS